MIYSLYFSKHRSSLESRFTRDFDPKQVKNTPVNRFFSIYKVWFSGVIITRTLSWWSRTPPIGPMRNCLWEMDTDYLPFLQRKITLVTSCWNFCNLNPFGNGSTLISKIFFHIREDNCWYGRQQIFTVVSLSGVSITLRRLHMAPTECYSPQVALFEKKFVTQSYVDLWKFYQSV